MLTWSIRTSSRDVNKARSFKAKAKSLKAKAKARSLKAKTKAKAKVEFNSYGLQSGAKFN